MLTMTTNEWCLTMKPQYFVHHTKAFNGMRTRLVIKNLQSIPAPWNKTEALSNQITKEYEVSKYSNLSASVKKIFQVEMLSIKVEKDLAIE